jgi:hypothetical protein
VNSLAKKGKEGVLNNSVLQGQIGSQPHCMSEASGLCSKKSVRQRRWWLFSTDPKMKTGGIGQRGDGNFERGIFPYLTME